MKLRTRSEIVHVLAQLYQHGVFICTTADKAQKEKWEPQLFDDEVPWWWFHYEWRAELSRRAVSSLHKKTSKTRCCGTFHHGENSNFKMQELS